MKAGRLFAMFPNDGDAEVLVNIAGTTVPVVRAWRYRGQSSQVILEVDRLKLLQLLEKLKDATDEKPPHGTPDHH
jgi:hypothetical protein